MRFLVDECTGPAVARWLREKGYDVFSVYDEDPGKDDQTIAGQALSENRILITNDKDFGEKVFREGQLHHGIILLRLSDERSENKITVLSRLLEQFGDRIKGLYVVVTDHHIRFAQGS